MIIMYKEDECTGSPRVSRKDVSTGVKKMYHLQCFLIPVGVPHVESTETSRRNRRQMLLFPSKLGVTSGKSL